jgi:hypothetical protein
VVWFLSQINGIFVKNVEAHKEKQEIVMDVNRTKNYIGQQAYVKGAINIPYNLDKDTVKRLSSIKFCQICGITLHHKPGNSNDRAVIDHCHKTGIVRGILCNRCNIIEGMIRDEQHLEQFYINYKKWILKS